jgi:hypothetical protein
MKFLLHTSYSLTAYSEIFSEPLPNLFFPHQHTQKKREKLFKFHSSLRLLLLFAFLGSFRFLSSVDEKEKDEYLKLFPLLWKRASRNQYKALLPMARL